MKYLKSRLYEREWHKFVIYSRSSSEIKTRLNQMTGEVMYRGGDRYCIVMLSSQEDRILFKLLGIEPDEDRGYGMWGGKKYYCANTNRIN